MSDSKPLLILAPIRGITDAVYRQAFARVFGGFDRAVAPFLQLRQGQSLRPGDLRQVAPENNRELPTIPQVLTNHAETFNAALRELHALGHTEVNWNLGCPYPMVTKRGRGAGLLPHPERIAAILDPVLNQCPVRLSVKLRLGLRDPDEITAVLDVLNRYPLSEVILHARIAKQMYEGAVDVERAGRALAHCHHPFVYNGDITTPAGFCELRSALPAASGWMIGRGALANPFLPALLKGTPLPEPALRRKRLNEFHDQLLEGYSAWLSGPAHLLAKMNEQWQYLALSFAKARQVFLHVHHCRGLAAYTTAVAWAFDQPLAPDAGDSAPTRSALCSPGFAGSLEGSLCVPPPERLRTSAPLT